MGRRASGLGQTLAIKFQAVGEKGKRRRIKSNEASKRTRDENLLETTNEFALNRAAALEC